ncbi:MAG: hypothetical protein AB7K09_02960 [Planctomycetota bacterium]
MTIRHTAALLLLSVLATALLVGCGGSQTLLVTTTPPGAEVQLQLKGQREYKASVDGVGSTSSRAGRFEDEFFTLGNSPASHTFELNITESTSSVEGIANEQVKRSYDSGTIRVSKAGYKTIDREVKFSGGELKIDLTLEPER